VSGDDSSERSELPNVALYDRLTPLLVASLIVGSGDKLREEE